MIKVPDEIWVTADGRRLEVGHMEEAHVREALRMIIRQKKQAAKTTALQRRLRRAIRAVNMAIDEEIQQDGLWGDS